MLLLIHSKIDVSSYFDQKYVGLHQWVLHTWTNFW
jgi:hypothetical protein